MWKKVVAPTVLVSLLWLSVNRGTAYILDQLDDSQTLLLNMNRSVIRAGNTMQKDVWRLQAVLFEAAQHHGKRSGFQQATLVEAKRLEAAFDSAFANALANTSTADEQLLANTIRTNFDRYRAIAGEQLMHPEQAPEDVASAVSAAMEVAKTVARPCEDLSELAERLTNESFQRRDRLRAKVNMVRFAFVFVGPAIGILLGVWVARGLNYSISQISVKLRDASGDLEQDLGSVDVYPSADIRDLPGLQQQVQFISGRIKHVVEELHSARRKAIESKRLAAVGELATCVAHEVRNPLTSVKLLIQAIQRNPALGPSDEQRLQIVRGEIARIETILQELLDYARPPTLRRLKHDVRETLTRTLNLASARALQSQVVIEEHLGAEPMIVDADPEQLQQVFVNLLLNAIDAMPDGGTLRLAVEPPAKPTGGQPGEPAARLLRIVFSDTGGGIPANVMPRLFEPFVTSKERGIGLGLAISRQIMHEHGGRLIASNPPGGGAMFVVEAPLAETTPPDAPLVITNRDQAPVDAREKACAEAEAIETADHR